MRFVLAVALILAAAVGLAWHRSSAIQEDLADGVEAALVAADAQGVVVKIHGLAVTLAGEVRDQETKKRIDRAVARLPNVESLVNAVEVAAAEDLETPLIAGTVEIGGNDTLETAAAALDVAAVASGATEVTREIVLWEDCQASLDTVLATGSIDFESSSAELSPASLPLLDELVAVLPRCGEAQVEIAGHTDASGSREENLDLSMARAEAVMTYLLAHNVTADQLSAIGYGPDRPMVDNATPEGRARNRRIELEVLNP